MDDILEAGRVVHDPDICVGCAACTMMCALVHGNAVGPFSARSTLVLGGSTADNPGFNVCRHCASPSCYFACPLKDEALCIDDLTGARYINENECTGCENCLEACPFDPPRIKFNEEKQVGYKCDLCIGREGGPICVTYCPVGALKFITREERQEKWQSHTAGQDKF
jgi:Fe-S-cluster-containing dehydrogenase component